MSSIDFSKFLPDENPEEIKKAKAEAPYNLIQEYAIAVSDKYKPKLKAHVTERTELIHVGLQGFDIVEHPVYSLSFEAAIGNGYLYRLLEIEQLTTNFYPIKVSVFNNFKSELGTYSGYKEFSENTLQFLSSGIVKAIIMNLIARVDLYNESRNEKFDWKGDNIKPG